MDPEFYAFVRYLKENLPHPKGKPVRVRTRNMASLFGSCNIDGSGCNIAIHKGQPHDCAIDTLCHEWAHMLDLHDRRQRVTMREEHRQSWGKHYARVYQHYRRFKKVYGDGA